MYIIISSDSEKNQHSFQRNEMHILQIMHQWNIHGLLTFEAPFPSV